MAFTFSTAFCTPLPPNLLELSSLSSYASYLPVEEPDGTCAHALITLVEKKDLVTSAWTSTSTVGLPRESNISDALILIIFAVILFSV